MLVNVGFSIFILIMSWLLVSEIKKIRKGVSCKKQNGILWKNFPYPIMESFWENHDEERAL